jgi:hypothetical protein
MMTLSVKIYQNVFFYKKVELVFEEELEPIMLELRAQVD